MKFISLFAGIGGFDLALQRHGHECVYANEWDKYAAQIYDKNFNTKIDQRDIRTVPTGEIPDHDLLVGGFPCQAFSIAGHRRGFDDIRGTLFFEIARILRDKKPRLFILENVKGLLSHDGGNTFKTIISTLVELGYDIQWQVVNSKNFGVPQNRERVFIIGHLRGTSRPEVFPIRQDDNPLITKGGRQASSAVISRTLTATDAKMHLDGNYIRQLNNPVHSNDRVYGMEGISPTLNTMQGGRRQPKIALKSVKMERSDESKAIRREMMKNGRDWSPRQGKKLGVRDDELMNTITANWEVNQAVTDGMKIRRLTPLECERLQGFPSLFDWTKGLEFGNIGDMTRDELISVALATNTIEVDQEYGVVYVLRGPGGTRLPEPRRCGTNCNGYLVANLMANGVKKQIRLHRAVWISKNGIPPEGQVVCHKDNNKTNNKIENLYLATHEQNSTDAKLSGLYKHTNAKIDFEIATNIRMDYGTEKYTMRELGDKYKLSKSRIHQIVRMKGWTEDGLDSSGNPTKISDTQRYKMCGNAVTVNVVEYIASLL